MELVLTNLLLISIGGCFGSFASSLIYRLPLQENEINILKPRSFCPQCKTQLSIIQLIPFIGFLYSRGVCLSCNAKINRLYFYNEVIIAVFILYIFSKLALTDLSSWLIVFCINEVYKMIRSRDGIGSGDFLLLGGIGSIFGASAIGPILLIGSSISLCLYAVNKNKEEELPLGFGLGIGAIFYCFLFIFFSIA
jgi:prepilin signal peptidase PulO-like enzyme (type II secretory pathway)